MYEYLDQEGLDLYDSLIKTDLSDLKSALNAFESVDGVLHYGNDGEMSSTASFPYVKRIGNLLMLNGQYGDNSTRTYSIKLTGSLNKASLVSSVETWAKELALDSGKTYNVRMDLISGTITNSANTFFEVRVLDSSNNVIQKIGLGKSKNFTWTGGNALLYLAAGNDINCSNVILSVFVMDVSETAINALTTQTFLSQFPWQNGKHDTRARNINSPTSSTNSAALLVAIPYNYNTFFTLADGWKASFCSVDTDGIITAVGASFESYANKITMNDIYNAATKGSAGNFSVAMAISLRKVDNSTFDISSIDIDEVIQMFTIIKETNPDGATKWVAIGDSLTDGRVTVTNGSNVYTKTNHFAQYGYIASKILGVDTYEEYGYGGLGYVAVATDSTTLTDVLQLDFGAPDIITINLGANDTSKTLGDENSTSNDGTISGAIKNCCEVLGATYPKANIIFMTPINKSTTGTASTGWAKESGTTHLQDIADMIKYWCNKFGFPVIDMLNNSPVNDFNIKTMLLDDLHPTIDAHNIIGKYLAGAMPFKIM